MSKSKKSISINIRLSHGDIKILDFIANKAGTSRSKTLSASIEHDISEMFGALDYAEKANLANLVDRQLSIEGYDHEYNGATWYWETVGQDPNMDNPADNEKWIMMKENLKKSK
jgi:hypothetical protein